MRVTTDGLYRGMVDYIQKHIEDISKVNEQIASGKKLLYLSDNPLDSAEVIKYNKELANIEQFNRDITRGNAWIKTTQNSLENVESLTRDAKTFAEQLATETYDYDNRLSISYAIDSIAEEIMQNANTDLNGKYIFSGFKTDKRPFVIPDSAFEATGTSGNTFHVSGYNYSFDLDLRIRALSSNPDHYEFSVDGGNTWISGEDSNNDGVNDGYAFGSVNPILGFTISVDGGTATAGEEATFNIEHQYQGDKGDIKLEVNKKEHITINQTGDEVFTKSDNKNIFKIMGDLWAGTVTNNRNLISEQLPKLENFEKHILKKQAVTGGTLNRFDKIKNEILAKNKESATQGLSDLESVDLSDAMTKLTLTQTIYQATLRSTAMISNLNITNFL